MNIIVWIFIIILASNCNTSKASENKMNHKLRFSKSAAAYAVLTTMLPIDLHEFTLCFWVRINHMNKGSNTIFSYAVESNDNEIRAYIEGHRDLTYFGFELKHFSVRAEYKIHLGAWYHFCNVWSSWNGHWIIYIDGDPIANGTDIAQGYPVQNGGLIVLGQDQDRIGGGFAPKDSLTGELLDLHMWNEILSTNVISDLAACLPLTGNIIAWLNSPFALYGGLIITPTQLCDTFTRPPVNCEAKPAEEVNDQEETTTWARPTTTWARPTTTWARPCWGTRC